MPVTSFTRVGRLEARLDVGVVDGGRGPARLERRADCDRHAQPAGADRVAARDLRGLSEQVQDYVAIDLPGRVASERGRSLMAMVDPYAYWLIDAAEINPARHADRVPGRSMRSCSTGMGCPNPSACSMCRNPGPRRAGPRSPDRGGPARSTAIPCTASNCRASTRSYAAQADRLGVACGFVPRTTPRARVDCEEPQPGIFARRAGRRIAANAGTENLPAASRGRPGASSRCMPGVVQGPGLPEVPARHGRERIAGEPRRRTSCLLRGCERLLGAEVLEPVEERVPTALRQNGATSPA